MLILGLDFETTWMSPIDVNQLKITEIGAVLWDTVTQVPAEVYSQLVWDSSYPHSPEQLVALTGITDGLLQSHGLPPEQCLKYLVNMMNKADAVCAHNGTVFDKPLFYARLNEHGLSLPKEIPWIDTMIDIPYGEKIQARKLVHLAAEHGFVNPFAHRAIFDVLTMLRVASHYPWEDAVQSAKEKTITAIAKVTFSTNKLAKERGYRWDPEAKQWYKVMKSSQFDKEQMEAPFNVTERKTV